MSLYQVNFYASLRKVSGVKSVDFQLPESATVNHVLESVLERYPQMRKKLLDSSGQLDRRAHIIIGGRNCLLLNKGLDTPLSTADTIDIFPIGHF